MADRQVELQLFKLFHNERQIRENSDEVAARRKDIDKIEKKKEKAELKKLQKELRHCQVAVNRSQGDNITKNTKWNWIHRGEKTTEMTINFRIN